jgi:thiosulfate dehydrogenase [quinone] large subunit
MATPPPSRLQQTTLILLRTLIGWQFAWEGFVKLWWPSWSRGGWPLPRWSAANDLQGASGPFADFFRGLAGSNWPAAFDYFIAIVLLLTGLALMLGLFTQIGTFSALVLLSLFYALYIPTYGVIVPGAEGNYLYVNKNLVEAAAVLVLLVFRTGRIAGLDLLLARRRLRRAQEAVEPAEATPEATS